MPSLTVENYVKTISLIAGRASPRARPSATGELAQALNVSPGTVTGMLKTLSEADLATYTPYEGAQLTAGGRAAGDEGPPPPPAARALPGQTLDMPWDEVHEEAEHMEHAASDRLIDRIDAFLGYPDGRPARRPDPPRRRLARRARREAPGRARRAGSGSGSSASSTRTRPSSAT